MEMSEKETKPVERFFKSSCKFKYSSAADCHNVSESKSPLPLITSTTKNNQSYSVTSTNRPSSVAFKNIDESNS